MMTLIHIHRIQLRMYAAWMLLRDITCIYPFGQQTDNDASEYRIGSIFKLFICIYSTWI